MKSAKSSEGNLYKVTATLSSFIANNGGGGRLVMQVAAVWSGTESERHTGEIFPANKRVFTLVAERIAGCGLRLWQWTWQYRSLQGRALCGFYMVGRIWSWSYSAVREKVHWRSLPGSNIGLGIVELSRKALYGYLDGRIFSWPYGRMFIKGPWPIPRKFVKQVASVLLLLF